MAVESLREKKIIFSFFQFCKSQNQRYYASIHSFIAGVLPVTEMRWGGGLRRCGEGNQVQGERNSVKDRPRTRWWLFFNHLSLSLCVGEWTLEEFSGKEREGNVG